MVCQEDGLGALEVGVAGQVGVTCLRGASFQGPLELEHMADHASQLGTGEQPKCRGDLVVPTPAGVELGPGLRGELGDAPLDRGMDVLVGLEILEAAGLQLSVHQTGARRPMPPIRPR